MVAILIGYLALIVALTLACGFGARAIMRGKGRSGAAGFCLGFFLGVPGIVIAAVLSPTPEHEAARMRKQMELLGMDVPGVAPTGAMPAPGARVEQSSSPGEWTSRAVAIGVLAAVFSGLYAIHWLMVADYWVGFLGASGVMATILSIAIGGVAVVGIVRRSVALVSIAAGCAVGLVGDGFGTIIFGGGGGLGRLLVVADLCAIAAGVMIVSTRGAPPSQAVSIGALVAGGAGFLASPFAFGSFSESRIYAVTTIGSVVVLAALGLLTGRRTAIQMTLAATLALAGDLFWGNGWLGGGWTLARVVVIASVGTLGGFAVQLLRQPISAPSAAGPPAAAVPAVAVLALAVAAPTNVRAAATWAADPYGRHQHRYFDGTRWTEHVADNGVSSTDVVTGLSVPQATAAVPTLATPIVPATAPLVPVVPSAPVAQAFQSAPIAPQAWAPDAEATVNRRPSPARAGSFRLSFSTGEQRTFSGAVVIGRGPQVPAELAGAECMTIADPTSGLSRSHVALGVAPDGVWVMDLGSANGTEIVWPDGRRQIAPPNTRVTVPIGSWAQFAEQWARVEGLG